MSKLDGITKKSRGAYTNSLVFLGIVIVITSGLYFYNGNLDKQISKIDTKIAKLEGDIVIIQQNPALQVSSLLDEYSEILKDLTYKSQLDTFINEIQVISTTYNIPMKGFRFSGGKIKTEFTANTDEFGLGFKKLSHFIKDYREQENAMFELGFISSIEGGNNLKGNIEFTVKKKSSQPEQN